MLIRLLNDQITELRITNSIKIDQSTDRDRFEVFGMILTVSKQLCDLNFSEYLLKNTSNSNGPNGSFTSSILTKLNVFVHSFDDCLYLLDGRFECLSTLIVRIAAPVKLNSKTENQVNRNPISSFEEICLKRISNDFLSLEKTP